MNYRCYHINNFYLNGIHSGIQSAHVQHELAMDYLVPSEASASHPYFDVAKEGYIEWAKNHKTIIVLNGGMQSDLEQWETLLRQDTNEFAWASFRESEEALNGALTNIGIVLPEYIYAYASQVARAADAPMGVCATVQRIEDNAECRYKKNSDGGARIIAPDGDELEWSAFELALMKKLAQCKLM